MRASPAVRGLRAAVFAALCVLLAAGGHALATGMAPPVWVQAAGFLPIWTAGYLLGARERSLSAIGGGILTAQGGLHLAFDAVRPHMTAAAHGMTAMHCMRMAPAHALTPHATAAHVSASVLLVWWLRRGEAALWSLLRAVAFAPGLAAWWQVRRGERGTPAAAARVVRPATGGSRTLRPVLLRHAVQRRGPPARTPYPI